MKEGSWSLTMFVTDDRVLETELGVFLIFKGLSVEVDSGINKCDLIQCNEMCHIYGSV